MYDRRSHHADFIEKLRSNFREKYLSPLTHLRIDFIRHFKLRFVTISAPPRPPSLRDRMNEWPLIIEDLSLEYNHLVSTRPPGVFDYAITHFLLFSRNHAHIFLIFTQTYYFFHFHAIAHTFFPRLVTTTQILLLTEPKEVATSLSS